MANGTSYRGTRDTTERGLRCQHWQATTPHDHRCRCATAAPGSVGRRGKDGDNGDSALVGNGMGTVWGDGKRGWVGGNGNGTVIGNGMRPAWGAGWTQYGTGGNRVEADWEQ